MIFIDSSVLLALYLESQQSAAALEILEQPEPKMASFLVMVEVPVVLRRVLSRPGEAGILASGLKRFDSDLQKISLIDSLTDVALRVRSDPRFARCRSLDAVHACTALLVREWTGHRVRVATFDRRLSALAAELGLS